jgi:hypothetical protein
VRYKVSNVVTHSRDQALSEQEVFRLRMENQCRQITLYRQELLRQTGQLLSPDEAALEWIKRYASSFDTDNLCNE